MNFGSIFQAAYEAATEAGKQAADSIMSSASAAAEATTRALSAASEGAVRGGVAAKSAAVSAGKGLGNVAGFGGRALGEGAAALGQASVGIADAALKISPFRAPYLAAKKLLAPKQTPRQTVTEPCPKTEAAKRKRLEERQQLIANGRDPGASPGMIAAADRLERNNEAVELARLSNDAYAQYGEPPVNDPPPGWSRLTDEALANKGIDPNLLRDCQAVMYQTPADWPGGQKTVLAFRGTADQEDILVDHDQALALPTAQYEAAARLGDRVSKRFGNNVLVTGHSLGGGKAQAAGTKGGLQGMMFNSAGLNPATLNGQMPASDQFVQYRTPYDPLTGVQNSALLQTAVASLAGAVAAPLGIGMKIGDAAQRALGLPGISPEMADYADKATKAFPRAMRNLWEDGNILPPAIGKIEEVPALNDQGKPVALQDVLGQHSIKSVVNGIEEQKAEDVATLRGS